jgi:hypothetical protein
VIENELDIFIDFFDRHRRNFGQLLVLGMLAGEVKAGAVPGI